MPYEIPKNLKYQEKIVFGLTFWQFLWLSLFGGLAGIIFFKTSLLFEVKLLVCIVFLLLGAGFAFFGFFDVLRDLNVFRKSIHGAGFFDERLKEFIEVKSIGDDTIFLRDGSLRAIIQVIPINFMMLSQEEQRAVVSAFFDFLNSLDFPLQIVVRTVDLSLDDYLGRLRGQVVSLKKDSLLEQFNSFQEFVREFIKGNNVKNRLFYVVVPFSLSYSFNPLNQFKDFIVSFKNFFSGGKAKTSRDLGKETALHGLNVRVKLCEEKLARCNLISCRLNSGQLTSLLASFFESFVEARNEYFFPVTLLEEFREKSLGEAN